MRPAQSTPPARRFADAAMALLVVSIVGMMIVPLPTPLLDVLITGNLSIAVLLVLVAMYVPDALSFTSFPTILLVTTLFRLALNVSSTRLILLQADAGAVIRAFGDLVVQGNYVVGAVVFLILTLVQFLVIAKGSERIAEVGARFTLDAMPGKQMAIDAELRTGGTTQDEARRKRRALGRESQFYGAMDGAMKFVKGDAIAGIVITAINVVGGLAIGVAMRDMSAADSLRLYGLLTIGDGLVSQIPSLLISTAAGLVVTRVASEDEHSSIGGDVGRQIFGNPRALAIAACFLVVLGLVPGLPTVPFFVLAAVFGGIALRLTRGSAPSTAQAATEAARREDARARESRDASVPLVVPIDVAVGSALAAKILDGRGGGVLLEDELPSARDELFLELGVSMPAVRARLDATLAPLAFTVRLHEIPVATVELAGEPDAALAASVAARVRREVRARAADFVGLDETQSMLDHLERAAPALVRNVVPKPVPLALLTDVLRRLAREGVSIRALREILEALATHAPAEKDPAALTELVRGSLRRHITHAHARGDALPVHLVDPSIEDALRDALARHRGGPQLALAPSLARDVIDSVRRAAAARSQDGDEPARPLVVLTQPDLRRFLRGLLEVELPDVVVLGQKDVDPGVAVKPVGRVSL